MIFKDVVLCFDFDSSVNYKEKLQIKNKVLSHGGRVSYSLNKKASFTDSYLIYNKTMLLIHNLSMVNKSVEA